MGVPGSSDGEESACNVGELGSTPGLGRSPGEGNYYPLQSSGLENSMDCSPWDHRDWGLRVKITGLSYFHFHFQPKPQIETRRTEGICAPRKVNMNICTESWQEAKCFHIMTHFVFPFCSIPRPLVESVCFLLSENISNFSLLACLSTSTPIEIDYETFL